MIFFICFGANNWLNTLVAVTSWGNSCSQIRYGSAIHFRQSKDTFTFWRTAVSRSFEFSSLCRIFGNTKAFPSWDVNSKLLKVFLLSLRIVLLFVLMVSSMKANVIKDQRFDFIHVEWWHDMILTTVMHGGEADDVLYSRFFLVYVQEHYDILLTVLSRNGWFLYVSLISFPWECLYDHAAWYPQW